MKHAAQLVHIRQLACLGLSGTAVMPALLKAVREFVGADSAGFFWVNAHGEMTNFYAERTLPPHLMRRYFERHHASNEHKFQQSFLALAKDSDPVSSRSASPAMMKTAYYEEILRELNAHHVLYAVIRDASIAIGQLSLYRPRSDQAFTAADRAAIRDISRYVSHAVARPNAINHAQQFVDSDEDGLVVVDGDCRIVQGTSASLHLLARALQQSFNAATPSLAVGDSVAGIVSTLVERIARIRQGQPAKAPREHIDGSWGRFVLSAYELSGDEVAIEKRHGLPRVGLHIQRKEQLMVRLVEAMGALDLSPQQREVAVLLAQGKSNLEIAVALNVSSNTAGYHVKQLFVRLDAHDRAEAVARLMASR